MAEYIERDAVFKIVADMMCDCKVRHKGRAINRNIKQLPTADVVTVVRCKGCKHCEHFYPECDVNGNHREAYYCKSIKGDVKPDDYCCWGERRSDDD